MAMDGLWTNGYQETEERRPGGYGGFGAAPQPSNGVTSMRTTNGGGSWNRNRSRSRGNTGKAAKRIEDVLYYIKQDWPFMTENECVPVQVALQLLDDSSLGLARRYDEFQDAQEQLQTALRAIVNEHHQGFNSSIGTFHQIQASIQSSHDRVRALKTDLVKAKTNLTSTKSEFQSLVIVSHNYDDMLKVLDLIEQVQQIPHQLEARISDKLFISAVDCLQEGLRLARSLELEDISALSDMRVYLSNQELSLTDILLEELHNHLYLKSPYCEERWKTYAKIHRSNTQPDMASPSSRQLYTFLDNLNPNSTFVEDTSRSPEADSFQYIQLLLEALSKLGHLEDAVEAVEQRLPVELFKVVERTNSEVQQRHPKSRSGNSSNKAVKTFSDLNFDRRISAIVLEDLLGVLYGRFEAIAESYRAFHEVIGGISRREDTGNTLRLTRAFKELWKLYQSEIRSLLHDYLSTDESVARGGQNAMSEGNVFRQQRDKNKKCTFKMDLVDSETPDLKLEQDEVVAYWQKFVPGLVSLPQASINSTATPSKADGSATGHKLLIEPSVFNITSLLPPSVTFLKRLRDLIPPGSDIVLSTLSSFLNDFLTNVFYPQLEETLVEFCSQSYMQTDAFQEHPQWARFSQKPVFRGSITFLEVTSAFCQMLDELTHDQLFSQLVIKQMNQYYDKCLALYRTLVTRTQARPVESTITATMKASAQLAEVPEVTAALNRIWKSSPRDTNAFTEEAQLLSTSTTLTTLDEFDLISSAKTQQALCLLYTSMRWTATKLASLRHVSPRADEADHTGMDIDDPDDRPQLKRSLTRALVMNDARSGNEPAHLPLNKSTAALFDGIVTGFRELADTTLRTLRLEMRCQAIHGLHDSFTGVMLYPLPSSIATESATATTPATATLATDSSDSPDESLLNLLNHLLTFNTSLSSALLPTDHSRITSGLSTTIDASLLHFLSSAASNAITSAKPTALHALNAPAAAHLVTNVRVLSHNLLNIEATSSLPKAMAFLEMFLQGREELLAEAEEAAADGRGKRRRGVLGEEEMRAVIKLMHSEGLRSQDVLKQRRAREQMEECLKTIG